MPSSSFPHGLFPLRWSGNQTHRRSRMTGLRDVQNAAWIIIIKAPTSAGISVHHCSKKRVSRSGLKIILSLSFSAGKNRGFFQTWPGRIWSKNQICALYSEWCHLSYHPLSYYIWGPAEVCQEQQDHRYFYAYKPDSQTLLYRNFSLKCCSAERRRSVWPVWQRRIGYFSCHFF
jgi:hypothetical protein